MKIRYCSDLHIEFNGIPEIKAGPDEVLLVAGDTIPTDHLRLNRTDAKGRSAKKNMAKFLMMVSGFAKIVFVGGNHEPYHGDINEWKFNLEQFIASCGYTVGNVTHTGTSKSEAQFNVLENEHVWLGPQVLLYGCTLWTDMFKRNPVAMQAVGQYMNDFYSCIRNDKDNRFFEPSDAISLHEQSLAYLTEQLKLTGGPSKPKDFFHDVTIIIMTHHAPTGQSIDSERGGRITDYGYFTELSEWILDRPKIKYWIHGHTHHNVDYMVGNCRVLTNQRGYNIKNVHTDTCFKQFNMDKFIEIE